MTFHIDLANPEQDQGEGDDENDPDRPVFSLITGTYRQAKQYGGGFLLLLSYWANLRALI
jgi:diphthamide biosynthesis protein 2